MINAVIELLALIKSIDTVNSEETVHALHEAAQALEDLLDE